MLKRILIGLAIASSVMLAGCSPAKVPVGNTAVIVNMMGDNKGVQPTEAGVGWKWLTWNEELFLFPTFNQNFNINGIKGQDKDGMVVGLPLGVTLRAAEGSAPLLYKTYRKSMEEIIGVNVPQVVRDAVNAESSKVTAETMYGPQKEDFIKRIQTRVQEHFASRGIVVENLYLNGQIDLPGPVVEALNRKIEATQKAQQRENELRQTQAEAAKEIAAAEGAKTAAILRAEGEAQALNIKGQALSKNPGVVELNAIEKWDGKLPTYNGGGALPFINIK
ncbi:putative transposase [Pseudomonas phage NV1]|uniref:Putative transposase n=1 Tax=Pseudomonas phage NV1 TaxID=2079543 RepID=A0A2L0HPK7_9CAUD|nr:putative transposase [Pseudomonas phage NV1]AUX83640.1 putative transposase [Pseudomonas phage NV1]